MNLNGQPQIVSKLQLFYKNVFLQRFVRIGVVIIKPYLAYCNALTMRCKDSDFIKAGLSVFF